MKYQWQYMIEKFKSKDGILTTFDMISDVKVAAEYRRLMCDLKKKGYVILAEKATPKQWVYRLLESDDKGQLSLVA